MWNFLRYLTVASLAALSLSHPVSEQGVAKREADDLPRLIIYYQTTHDRSNNPISMLPLITEQGIALTHLIVCSLHINLGGVVHLNDFPPANPRFDILWEEAAILQAAGVKLLGMVGGAAPGSFASNTLDSTNSTTFEYYYGQLRDVLRSYNLQGLDIDVEQSMSQSGIKRLIDRLYVDFGPDFEITLAPVASALSGGSNLSGFSYKTLEAEAGDKIAFHNAQFYNGFGSMTSTTAFERVVASGFSSTKVVVGQITTPANGGGFVPFETLGNVIHSLQAKFGQIGGIMGWEYFNSEPGGNAKPWEWAQKMTAILRPQAIVDLRISREIAERLSAAWDRSAAADNEISLQSDVAKSAKPDYFSWINV